jgi:hypothetical protein
MININRANNKIQMKNDINTNKASGAKLESKGTLPQHSIPELAEKSTTHASHLNDGKAIASKDGISLDCFACYLEKSIQGTMDVLEAVRKMVSRNGKKANIEEGFDLAQFTLDALLEQLAAKPHGEGLPGGPDSRSWNSVCRQSTGASSTENCERCLGSP